MYSRGGGERSKHTRARGRRNITDIANTTRLIDLIKKLEVGDILKTYSTHSDEPNPNRQQRTSVLQLALRSSNPEYARAPQSGGGRV